MRSFNGRLSPTAELQMVQLYQPALTPTGLVVTVIPIQQQSQQNNCGVFSIAAAFHAAAGGDLRSLSFDERRMQPHLIQCFEEGKIAPFPLSPSSPKKRANAQNSVIPVNCQRRRPDSWEQMVACDSTGSTSDVQTLKMLLLEIGFALYHKVPVLGI